MINTDTDTDTKYKIISILIPILKAFTDTNTKSLYDAITDNRRYQYHLKTALVIGVNGGVAMVF